MKAQINEKSTTEISLYTYTHTANCDLLDGSITLQSNETDLLHLHLVPQIKYTQRGRFNCGLKR